MSQDHYLALGVTPGATPLQIRQAYLRVMRADHPDRRPGDPEAAERARRATAAWAVLRDEQRRRAYDAAVAGRRHEVRVVVPRRPRVVASYSPDGVRYRRGVQAVCYRFGAGVFAVGLVLLSSMS